MYTCPIGCSRPISLGFAIAVILLFICTGTGAFADPIVSDPQLVGENQCGTQGGIGDVVADGTGLVYAVWMTDSLLCPGLNARHCENAHIAILDGGRDTPLTEMLYLPGNGLLGYRGISAALESGDLTNPIYFTWGQRDNCTTDFDNIFYAKYELGKHDPGSITLIEHDAVTTYDRHGNAPDISLGPSSELHFGWSDQRCTPEQYHSGSILYREKHASGWVQPLAGRYCGAEQGWEDFPSLVNQDCNCCPRTYFKSCTQGCPLFYSVPAKLYTDGSNNTHILWHDTDACATESWEDKCPDVAFHRELTSLGWSDTTRVGIFQTLSIDGCLMPDGRLAMVWEDKRAVDEIEVCGFWFSAKDPDGDFTDPELVYVIDEDCTGDTTCMTMAGTNVGAISVESDDDSRLHIVWRERKNHGLEGTSHNLYYRIATPSPEGIVLSDVFQITNYPVCTSNQQVNECHRALSPNIVMDACGNAHVFYSHTFTIDNQPLEKGICRVVIRNTDQSCAIFSPAGGEVWENGSIQTISWKLCPGYDQRVSSQSIYVSNDEGQTFGLLADDLHRLARAYQWQIDVDPDTMYRVKVVTYLEELVGEEWVPVDPCEAVSSANFEVAPDESPVVTVIAPNGGETWKYGATYDIKWTASDNVEVTSVDLLLSTDGGATFPDVISAGEPNDGVYALTVPHKITTHGRVKAVAYDAALNSGEDMSDGNFEIYQPSHPGCPQLYCGAGEVFEYVNTVLRIQPAAGPAMDDYLIVDGVQPGGGGVVRFAVEEAGVDTTYIYAAHITPLCNTDDLVATPDGELFKPGETSQPIMAVAEGHDILPLVSAWDGQVFEADEGVTTTITLPGFKAEAVLLLTDMTSKPPIGPLSGKRNPRGGVEIVTEDGALFDLNSGTSSSFTLPPRERPSRFAIPLISQDEDVPVTLKIHWLGKHTLDCLALCTEPEQYIAARKEMEPVAVQFIPSGDGSHEPQGAFPYKLGPGDRLSLDFLSEECPWAESISFLVRLSGYYTAPTGQAGVAPGVPLSLWLTSIAPCNSAGLNGRFSVPRPGWVTLEIYDVRGRLLKSLVRGHVEVGTHEFNWDLRDDSGRKAGSGVYFARLRYGDETRTCRVVVVR